MIKNNVYLAAATLYKTDPWNILEWIEYHLHVGVRLFFIFNNDDDTRLSDAIFAPYVEKGLLINFHSKNWFTYPRVSKQADCYTHALLAAKGRAKWLAILDSDEFIYPIHKESLVDVLRGYEDCASIACNYANFGSSGLKYRPELQTESYIHRAADNWEWNRLSKAIGQTAKFNFCDHHHKFAGSLFDEHKNRCGWVKPFSGDLIRINHYMARSREDFYVKMLRGNPFGEKRDWNWFNWADRNEVFDDGMANRFAPAVREALENADRRWRLSQMKIAMV